MSSGRADPQILQVLCEQGAALHRVGRLDEAAVQYDKVLKRNPRHFDALHLLGLVRLHTGRPEQAVALFARAVKANPKVAVAQDNLGAALVGLGRAAEALASLDAAIALKPDFFEARFHRAVALRALGRRDEALADLDAATALNGRSPEAHNLRAIVLHELKRPAEALASYDATVGLRPAYAEAWNNRGVALGEVGAHEAALASHDQAIALKPDFADAHYNRGVALDRLKRPIEALASLDAAIALAPGHARAHHNRGTALEALGRSDEAVAAYDRAVALKPDYAEAFSNRGLALRNLQRLDAAAASYDAAIALDPASVDAHVGRGFLELLAGDFAAGWRDYEWRKAGWDAARRPDPERDWLGEADLAGRRLLVRHEQGLGDSLQFARYLPLLVERGAEVTFVVQPPLAGLLAASLPGVRVVAEGDEAPGADLQASLMSLPLAVSTTLASIPPPLRLDAGARRADWARRLGPKTRPRIGLAWSGNPAHTNDHNRSIGLAALAPLLDDRFDWIALQNEIRPADAEAFAASGRLRFFGEALGDFADTAALAEQTDLIITVDTSLAHLAGSLGKPVWVLLAHAPDWRWLLGRADSPWYPTARLFRQPSAGDWAGVVADVAAALGDDI